MMGAAARAMTEAEEKAAVFEPLIGSHGSRLPRWVALDGSALETPEDGVPHGQVFSEGNGNEHRRSFKGYPKGYAASPTNHHHPKGHAAPLPRHATQNAAAPFAPRPQRAPTTPPAP